MRRQIPVLGRLLATAVLALVGFAVVVGLAGPALAAGEMATGRLVDPGTGGEPATPIEGAQVVVTTADGAEVGTGTSDAQGRFSVDLPGPGSYIATIQVDSLPEGVTLRNPDRAALSFTVAEGGVKPLLYPLGESTRQTTSDFDRGIGLAVDGIRFGLVIAMGAIGLSLIFGTTGLTNFAHGELLTGGALIAYLFNVTIGLPFIPAALLAIVAGGLGGYLLDAGFWRRLRARGTGLIAMLVVSIGMSLFLRYLYLYIFGGQSRPFDAYRAQTPYTIGPVTIEPKAIWSIVISILVLVGVGLALQRTRIGKATRAVADNPALAAASGIDVERVISVVWIAGGALAALGGVLLGLDEQVQWLLGFQVLLLIFASVTLGGLGTAYGALVGSLVVGVFIQVSTLFIPTELKNVGRPARPHPRPARAAPGHPGPRGAGRLTADRSPHMDWGQIFSLAISAGLGADERCSSTPWPRSASTSTSATPGC